MRYMKLPPSRAERFDGDTKKMCALILADWEKK
jgi:hypothetical protein